MILKRKPSAPVFTDSFGIAHPNLIIGFYAVPEDKLNGWIEIRCGYYHNVATYLQRKEKYLNDPETNLLNFTMRFDENAVDAVYVDGTRVKLGYPDYASLKQSIEVGADGALAILVDDVVAWILNQEFIKDLEGLVFAQNWEVDLTV